MIGLPTTMPAEMLSRMPDLVKPLNLAARATAARADVSPEKLDAVLAEDFRGFTHHHLTDSLTAIEARTGRRQ